MRVNELLNEAFSLNPMTAERAEKEFGKGTWKRITFKQEGGNDGYQYAVRVDGKLVANGLTRREAEAEKLKQADKIAKAKKIGKYLSESEDWYYWTDSRTGHKWKRNDEYEVNITTGQEYNLDGTPVFGNRKRKTDNKRFYHEVPFAKKEDAKAEGMRWDPVKKKWYHSSAYASSKSAFKVLTLAEASKLVADWTVFEKMPEDSIKAELEHYTDQELVILVGGGYGGNMPEKLLKLAKAEIKKRRMPAIKEDWGSSDWYPVLQAMAEELLHGSSMKDAAYNAGAFYKEHMGYPPTAEGDEDMIDAVMARWERLPEDRKKFFMDQAKERKEKLKAFQKKPVTEAWTVVIKNKDGVGKRFPSKMVDSEEAKEWRNSSAPKVPRAPDKGELDRDLYFRVTNAISASFPDGDPLDQIAPFLHRNKISKDDINRVMKKFGGITYDKYLANMWDDYAGDEIADANAMLRRGKLPPDSTFYTVQNGNGHEVTGKEKIVKNSNPWK